MKNIFKKTYKLLVLLVLVMASCNKEDTPTTTPPVVLLPSIADGTVKQQDPNFINALYAIGQFEGDLTCTGVYIKTSENANAPAYILTNGHCVNNQWDDNKIIVNQDYTNAKITFKVMEDVPASQQVSFSTKKIAYGTMKGRDIAIVELNATNADLKAAGIEPINIADAAPAEGTEIRTYGFPLKFDKKVLRQTSCVQQQKKDIAEFIWLWFDAYTNQCTNIYSGSSGSPVIADFNQGVWGLVNTTTTGATTACELGSPCEWTNTGITLKNSTNYVMDITDLKACFGKDGFFNTALAYTVLEKPDTNDANMLKRNYSLNDVANHKLEIKTTHTGNAKYLLSSIQDFNKDQTEGYTSFTGQNLTIDFPKKEGLYVVALNYNNNFDQRDFLTFVIDGSAPDKDLIKIIVNQTDNELLFEPEFKYPELVGFEYKFDVASKCDCNDTSGYETYMRIPIFVNKKDYPFPLKICIIGEDLAGNKSLPKEFLIN